MKLGLQLAKMPGGWLVAAFVVSGLPALPAIAQRTGTRIGHDAVANNSGDAMTGFRLIAECFYDREPKDTVKLLSVLPGSPEERRLLERDAPNLSACLDRGTTVFDGKSIKMKATVLRSAVAAEVARRLLARGGVLAAPPADTAPWFEAPLKQLPANADVDRGALAIQDFGHCVALARWMDASALILSADGSAEEAAAVARLMPFLGPCLDAGSNFAVTRRTLRYMIGEPVYHLVSNNGIAVAGSK